MENTVFKIKIDKDRYIDYIRGQGNFDVPACESCPYSYSCFYFPYPYEDENKDFSNFCQEYGEKFGRRNHPMPGELERLFPERPDIREILDHNPPVRLKDIISHTCATFCQYFEPDFKNCNGENRLCILKDIFRKNDETCK